MSLKICSPKYDSPKTACQYKINSHSFLIICTLECTLKGNRNNNYVTSKITKLYLTSLLAVIVVNIKICDRNRGVCLVSTCSLCPATIATLVVTQRCTRRFVYICNLPQVLKNWFSCNWYCISNINTDMVYLHKIKRFQITANQVKFITKSCIFCSSAYSWKLCWIIWWYVIPVPR